MPFIDDETLAEFERMTHQNSQRLDSLEQQVKQLERRVAELERMAMPRHVEVVQSYQLMRCRRRGSK